MTQEFRDRWCAALRSGEYKQATGDLREGDCFCAQGVLCDIHPEMEWDTDSAVASVNFRHFGFAGYINPLVCEKIGVPWRLMEQVRLMNDGAFPTPFPVIADWIEANIPVSAEALDNSN